MQSTKRALVLSNQLGDVEDVVVAHTRSKEMLRVYASDNIKVTSQPILSSQTISLLPSGGSASICPGEYMNLSCDC